jgi:uncharacterized protein (TIGR02246 family)
MTTLTNSTTALTAIDRTRGAHVSAVNAGDAAGWAALFAGDGVQMPPNMPANTGKEAILQWVQGFCAAFWTEFALSVEEVHAAEGWAFERGTYTITLTHRASGSPMRENGKYITVYQAQPDGTWLMARDMWSSDQPAPSAP